MTDNPIFAGSRFPDVVRPGGSAARVAGREPPQARGGRDQAPVGRGGAHLPRGDRGAAQDQGRRPLVPGDRPLRPRRRRRGPADLRQAGRGRQGGHRADERPAGRAQVRQERHRRAARRLPQARGRRRRVGRQADGRGARRRLPGDARRHRHRARRARLRRARHAHLAPLLVRGPVPDPPPPRREGRRRHRLVRLHPRRGAHAAVGDGPDDPGQDARRGPDAAVRRRRRGRPARPPLLDQLQRLADHGARHALADDRRPRADGAAPLRRRRGGRRRRDQEALRRRRQRRARAS